MRFEVTHRTSYLYSQGVRLGPQTVRLRPRCDGSQRLLDYRLSFSPNPVGRSDLLDAEGNVVTRAWFEGRHQQLTITSSFRLDTLRDNPYDFLPQDEIELDRLYPEQLRQQLQSYRAPSYPDPRVSDLASQVARDSGGDVGNFLARLNTMMHERLRREIREQGHPQTPGETLGRGVGACRDLAVLFIEVCRVRGLAARFVSGYQQGDTQRERRYLHAWPEVYLPGGGWRGFDPTHGLAIADRHVAVAAASTPRDAAPVEGTFFGEAESELESEVSIRVD